MMCDCGCLCGLLNPITNVLLKIVPYAKQEGDEANKLDQNRRKLQRSVNLLNAKRRDIETEIKNNNIMRKTTDLWHSWVNEVEKIAEEARNLEIQYKNAKRLHYITCSSLSRAELSREMEAKADGIDSLANRMTRDMAMTDRDLTASANQSFRKKAELEWVTKNVDRILRFLQDENVKKIGVWAFAGMGKTSIMESLKEKACGIGFFEQVLFVTLEEEGEERTRQCIFEQLNLRLNVGQTTSSDQIARAISAALKDKKYLLILDQVSQEIDLRKLGIQDNHMNGKVVVATRYKTICDKMRMDESWELKKMSEVDAWMLFRQIAGEEADDVSKRFVAKGIVKECGGVPLLINAVATYLKSEDNDHVWSDCLTKLQSSTYDDLEAFGESQNIFKLIYDRLKLDYRKKCFLYGALYPEDHEIYEDHLMECWRAEHFIPAAGSSNDVQVFRRARLEGHATMKCLVDACLLKRCRKVKYVTMPNLFRTWALKTDEGVHSLVEPSNDMEKCQNPKWISLKCNDLNDSLQAVNFNRVTTLFLQRNEILEPNLVTIFVLKSKLRVLDLGYTRTKSLPPSISNLIHLKALYLNDCSELCELPEEIANLNRVEILDICRTGFSHWPNEIGSMVGLRCLRVSFIRKVGVKNRTQVPAKNVIGKLSALEELTIVVDDDYQIQWNGIYIDEKWNTVVQDISKEIANLQFLTTLRIYFPSVKCLEAFLKDSKSWKKVDSQEGEKTFRSFNIIVGSFWRHQEINITEHKAERHLKFFAYNESSVHDGTCSTISKVLMQACTFELIGHRAIAHLSMYGINSMAGLKICAIKDCNQMSSIISGNHQGEAVLKELKQLHLINLRNLALICSGLVGERSFASLTTLKINNCQALSVILSAEMIQQITSLEHLRVENCSNTTVIIDVREQHVMTLSFLKLKRLELINLPMLQDICQNDAFKWPALRTIDIDRCPMMQSFPLILNNADNLRMIKCQSSWWNQLNQDVRSQFERFCQFSC